MKITSMDISNKEFKKVIRGYNADEVDDFLDKVAEDYETLYKENSSMKEKLSNVDERLEHYVKMESTIQNTLLLAQNAAEQAKQNAQKESELMLRNANEASQKIVDKAHNDVLTIHDEYETVKQEFMRFKSKFRSFINSQLEMFDSMEKDFIKSYNLGKEEEIVENIKNKDDDANTSIDSEENNKPEDFKLSNVNEDFFNDKNSINEIKNFFVKE